MTNKQLNVTGTTSQDASLLFYIPVEIYTDNNPTFTPLNAPSTDAFPDNGEKFMGADVVLLTQMDDSSNTSAGLCVWNASAAPPSYEVCVPYVDISVFLTTGGYCKIYTGTRNAIITPNDPDNATYNIYTAGNIDKADTASGTIPANSDIFAAIYTGVPFLLAPATKDKLGSVMVPDNGGLLLGPNGSLSALDASASNKGVVQFIADVSEISATAANTLAVDNKNLGKALVAYAPLASPILTGTPTSITPLNALQPTMIATVEYVNRQISAAGVGSRTSQQYWKSVKSTSAVPGNTELAASWTIKSNSFKEGDRLDFSFIINDHNPDNNTSPGSDGSNSHSTKNRGVRVVLNGAGTDNVDLKLIGASVTDINQSLSQQYVGAIGTSSSSYGAAEAKQTYIDKKIEGTIWQDVSGTSYFMVTLTELGEKNASVTTSYPAKINTDDCNWLEDIDLKVICVFNAENDVTFIADGSVNIESEIS